MYYFSAIATGQGSGNPACAGRNCRSVQLCNCPMNSLAVETVRKHKVAGVAGAILFDVAKLRDGGGFEFWQELPPNHCGEEHNSG